MYKPKNSRVVIFRTEGINRGMLMLNTQLPRNINNHTLNANTIMNIIIWPIDIFAISSLLAITLANRCLLPPGIAAAMLESAETKDVAIIVMQTNCSSRIMNTYYY